MSVYNDMANDAGYKYGSDENERLAQTIEHEEYLKFQEKEYERQMEEQELIASCETPIATEQVAHADGSAAA